MVALYPDLSGVGNDNETATELVFIVDRRRVRPPAHMRTPLLTRYDVPPTAGRWRASA